ncbi:unnamed protein product, partial [Closterium sp. Naga37s-1]
PLGSLVQGLAIRSLLHCFLEAPLIFRGLLLLLFTFVSLLLRLVSCSETLLWFGWTCAPLWPTRTLSLRESRQT